MSILKLKNINDEWVPVASIQGEKGEPGGVVSVNGETGTVVLDASDINTTTTHTSIQANLERIDTEIGNIPIVSVSATGTATSEVNYITIDGIEKKLAGGGSGDSSNFIITVTQSGSVYSADKTYNEIMSAISADKLCFIKFHGQVYPYNYSGAGGLAFTNVVSISTTASKIDTFWISDEDEITYVVTPFSHAVVGKITHSGGTYTCDKSFSELSAARSAGIACFFSLGGDTLPINLFPTNEIEANSVTNILLDQSGDYATVSYVSVNMSSGYSVSVTRQSYKLSVFSE